MKIKIGSRASQLAVAQAQWVGQEMQKHNSGLEISFIQISTTGDKQATASLQSIGGKGVFIKEIEEALLRKDIDIAVHSLKDVPQAMPDGLCLGPTPLREDVHDVLISRFGEQLRELPKGSVIGTSSPRRIAQIKQHFSKRQYRIEPIRGNVETRIKKMRDGQFDAIVLAAAGLNRLGLSSEITELIPFELMIPAPGQGALGIELRDNQKDLMDVLASICHQESDIAARAERAFLQGFGGDCMVPIGVLSRLEAGELKMKSILLNAAGDEFAVSEQAGPADSPELVGGQLAERLLAEGGSALLMKMETSQP